MINCCYQLIVLTITLQSIRFRITFHSRLKVLWRYDIDSSWNGSSYNQQQYQSTFSLYVNLCDHVSVFSLFLFDCWWLWFHLLLAQISPLFILFEVVKAGSVRGDIPLSRMSQMVRVALRNVSKIDDLLTSDIVWLLFQCFLVVVYSVLVHMVSETVFLLCSVKFLHLLLILLELLLLFIPLRNVSIPTDLNVTRKYSTSLWF